MKRTKHGLSYYNLTSCDLGQLVPVGLTEVLPGDTFNHQTSALVRLSPLVTPVMHPVQIRIHHWFVPMRLIWATGSGGGDWEEFITGGPDGANASVPDTLNVPSSGKDLYDYFGVPPDTPPGTVHNLPVRAYNLIFNEWYRDQDLVDEVAPTSRQVQRCAWEKDYFTSARPFTQKGPGVSLPLAGRAPVLGLGVSDQNFATGGNVYETMGDGTRDYASARNITNTSTLLEEDPDNPGYPALFADLSRADAVDVNEFRKAFALQRYQEARAGTAPATRNTSPTSACVRLMPGCSARNTLAAANRPFRSLRYCRHSGRIRVKLRSVPWLATALPQCARTDTGSSSVSMATSLR